MAVSHRGAISFGMVHIPVGLYTATQDNDIHFNQLCKEDGSRVKYKKVCAYCGKEVGTEDIVKGFEYEKGKYVTMTDDDFEKAKTEKDKTIHILHFAELSSIRPIYSDKTYHAVIGVEGEPFDNADYIFELKVDGERCVAYLDPAVGTELRNKRNMKLLPKVPELANLHEHVSRRCILDGELAVIVDGKPDFFAIQRRSLTSNPVIIQLAAQQQPASFVAFDILYLDDRPTNTLPLMERKGLLQEAVRREDACFAVSRYIEQSGTAFFELAKAQELEGVVAKRRDSRYYFDKRTKDWIKIKYLKDEDFVVCGYLRKENHMNSIVLGQYHNGQLIYKGHVTLGVGGEDFRVIMQQETVPAPSGNENAVWIEPRLVCTVRYMMKTESGGMRSRCSRACGTTKRRRSVWNEIEHQETQAGSVTFFLLHCHKQLYNHGAAVRDR